MDEHSPTPRWPLYEQRCREWTEAVKQLRGEFRRDRSGDRYLGFMLGVFGMTGAWIIWATTVGPHMPLEAPFEWLLPAEGLLLLLLVVLLGRKRLGVRYQFQNGEVSEISIAGRVRWAEPLPTLERVTFPWPARNGPQRLALHWSTHQRTIELFPSIETAVGEIIRARHELPDESPERPWRCEMCGEENPQSFEVCWKCNAAARGTAARSEPN